MRDITTKFGTNAGKIWSTLSEKGCLKQDEILTATKLDEKDFHTSVGWLARENKISRREGGFKLENTNLYQEIGSHAGSVWKILDIWGDADIETLKKLSDLDENQVHTAIGWLAREDKIAINNKNRLNLK